MRSAGRSGIRARRTAPRSKARYYQYQLPLLVKDWRARWGSEFPFAWAQLPNFDGGDRIGRVREAMLKTLALPKTGHGHQHRHRRGQEHPSENKQEAGRRLAQWALGAVYGKPVATSGPLPAGHEIRGRSRPEIYAYRRWISGEGGDLRVLSSPARTSNGSRPGHGLMASVSLSPAPMCRSRRLCAMPGKTIPRAIFTMAPDCPPLPSGQIAGLRNHRKKHRPPLLSVP